MADDGVPPETALSSGYSDPHFRLRRPGTSLTGAISGLQEWHEMGQVPLLLAPGNATSSHETLHEKQPPRVFGGHRRPGFEQRNPLRQDLPLRASGGWEPWWGASHEHKRPQWL